MRPVPSGKSVRMSFSRQKEVLEMPNLIEIQKDSYQWFLDEGLMTSNTRSKSAKSVMQLTPHL